jgi:hypothetical protein
MAYSNKGSFRKGRGRMIRPLESVFKILISAMNSPLVLKITQFPTIVKWVNG